MGASNTKSSKFPGYVVTDTGRKVPQKRYLSEEQVRIFYPEVGKKRITRSLQRRAYKSMEQFYERVAMANKKEMNLVDRLLGSNNVYSLRYLQDKLSFIPREFKVPGQPALEFLINIILFGLSLQISWPAYLLYYPTGKNLISGVFLKTDDATALVNFAKLAKTLFISGIPDEQIRDFLYKMSLNFSQHLQELLFNYGLDPDRIDILIIDQVINKLT